ncbi:MAG: hypothetical protein CVU55_13425 [Deltaproteobacteria bacterium HGW-Deltaproteobacteria-13]|jgi:hypothetical protein|nr:MAG: hypothetical protein CVU55_13425 [Deltaproteobacteria bacterium HGW-Deltaproteobacteria-13]
MMAKHEKIGIVISIYKPDLSEKEKISIAQAFQVLKKYRIIFVAPQSLDIRNYKKCFEAHDDQFIRFNDRYFYQGLEGYNELLLSEDFYKIFSEFSYVLIYQPDAYVFRDELAEWCEEGYDYIGAPWLEDKNEQIKLNGVGNGGFSLRNIEKFLYVLSKCKIQTVSEESKIKKRFYKIQNKTIALRLKLLNLIGSKKAVYYRDKNLNEDGFWGEAAPKITRKFKTAPVEKAVKFAFDRYPDVLYKMNNDKLPFGCHAWEKRNPEFWKEHIPEG